MVNIDKVLKNSTYVPTTHKLTHSRKDGRDLFFRYKDNQGRGVYFKVSYQPNAEAGKKYSLYSVVDKLE